MQQATATEYQTQHNIAWPKGNHTNTADTVDTGVLPQHHHAGVLYYHRGTSSKTKSYEHEGYGHYNSGHQIYDEFEQDEYGSYGNEDYRDGGSDDYQYGGGYYNTYYHRREYNRYGYDDYNYDDGQLRLQMHSLRRMERFNREHQ